MPLFLAAIEGNGTTVEVHQEDVDAKAVRLMADLYVSVNRNNPNLGDHEVNVLISRLLFLMFAEDTALTDPGLFKQFIRTYGTQEVFGSQLSQLFEVLNTPTERRATTIGDLDAFPYVNGGLFEERLPIIGFTTDMVEAVNQAAHFDWSKISPAIFGSMFQSIKDKDARRALGEHYITEENIMRTLEPLFLRELRQEARAAGKDKNKIQQVQDKIAQLTVIDPACGCGNFLIVALRELRKLDISLLERSEDLSQGIIDTDLLSRVKLSNFIGFEIDEWPASVARTALFMMNRLMDLKMIEQFGHAPDRLPITDQANIVHGNALRLKWEDIVTPSENVVIVGNPPFVGQMQKSDEQRDDLALVWDSAKDTGYLDYVTAWFKKAADYFHTDGVRGRFAFVSTNSVNQGKPVAKLFNYLYSQGWHITFAHKSLKWTSEAPKAANVTVSIQGFSKNRPVSCELVTYPHQQEPRIQQVPALSPYLTAGAERTVTSRSTPLSDSLSPVRQGMKATDGGFLTGIDQQEFERLSQDPALRPYLRPFVMGKELINSIPRYCLWLNTAPPPDPSASGDRTAHPCRPFVETWIKKTSNSE